MDVRNGKGSITRLIAGIILIILSLMTAFHDIHWWIGSLIIGISHVVSSTTGFCLMELFLNKVLGLPVVGKD